MKICELPPDDRPREKLATKGPGSLTDAELLAIFLRTGCRGKSAIAVASELIANKGSLGEIALCEASELVNAAPGIGPAKAAELSAAVELGRRLAKGAQARQPVDSADAVYQTFRAEMNTYDREVLKVVLLDTKLRLIRDQNISTGSLSECLAHPREIFRPAIVHRAYAVIVLHNHPSGDPAPSQADHAVTRRLREAADLLQINLMDHIIIGTPDGGRHPFFSFREAGMV
ncbi:MAG: DNA repair protein RadC [Terrimicrobiaceae bacterium]